MNFGNSKKHLSLIRISQRILLLVGGALIIALSLLTFYFLSTKNKLNGELITEGLTTPVTIRFDQQAIPHIKASNAEDAWHSMGFLHATERPWQMEFNRRLAAGKLSEILGSETIAIDKFIRTLGIRRVADQQYENFPIEYKRYLQAYADGVNAGFKHLGWALPPEFLILGVSPGLWSPADSVAWSLMMALDLGGNWHKEFLRLELSKNLETHQIWEAIPPYPGETIPTSVNFAKIYKELGLFNQKSTLTNSSQSTQLPIEQATAAANFPSSKVDQLRQLFHWLPGGTEGVGSNNWVISGDKTASGKPLLANDPHLNLSAPATWYMAHIESPEFNTIGATIPGIPTVIIGRTEQLAWGFTNTDPDVQDLYIEALDPNHPGRYKTPHGHENFILREETISVKGQSQPIRFIARETRHGPVISDAYPRAQDLIDTQKFALSMRWTALDLTNQTLVAGFKMNQAQTPQQFKNALKTYYAPMQSVVMASQDGQIAFYTAGAAPKRSKGQGLFGSAPNLGWESQYDWKPYIAIENLPQENNPSKGWLASANHRIHAANDPNPLTADWHLPYRYQRIETLINNTANHDLNSMKAIQTDTLSLSARELLPFLMNATSDHPLTSQAKQLLHQFEGDMTMNSPAATIYNEWAHQLTLLMFEKKLAPSFAIEYGKRDFRPGLHHILNLYQQGNSSAHFWCDLGHTPKTENCDDLINISLTNALTALSKRLGNQPELWQWGKVHTATSEHKPFSKVSLLKRHFEINEAIPGDAYTINMGFMNLGDAQNPFKVSKAASLRIIFDFSNLDQSVFIYPTGQSGWINSSHYSDYSKLWSRGDYLPLSMSVQNIQRTITLKSKMKSKPSPSKLNLQK